MTDRSSLDSELWECRPCARRVEVAAGAPYGWRCKVCGRRMRQVDTSRRYVARTAVEAWQAAREVLDSEVIEWVTDPTLWMYVSKRLKPLLERQRAT